VSPLLATLRLDVALQARSRLYVIGLGVAVVMGAMVRYLIPEAHVGRGLAAFYVLGVGGPTFMFGASTLLRAKEEGTLAALRVSGLSTRDYVASKALTLTAFALVESAVVYAIAARGVETRYVALVLGAAVLGLFYTLLGLGLASGYRAITTFLLPTGTVASVLLQLPFLSLVGIGPAWVYYLIPTQAPLLIIQGAFEPLAAWQWAYAAAMSAAMLLGAALFCRARFHRHVRLADARRVHARRLA